MSDFLTTLLIGKESIQSNSKFSAAYHESIEALTLGGLLTLRCEIEMICKCLNIENGQLTLLINNKLNEAKAHKILSAATSNSRYIQSRVKYGTADDPESQSYPFPFINRMRVPSYYSTLRVAELSSALQVKPYLCWNSNISKENLCDTNSLPLEFIAVHLKNSPNNLEGTANPKYWNPILERVLELTPYPIFFTGDDDYSSFLFDSDRVFNLSDLDIPLEDQLFLIGSAVMFIGTASGIAAAAMYSNAPYVIFKDPSHHTSEMNDEMGLASKFPWAASTQKLFRQVPEFEIVKNAFYETGLI